jgi:hypothetical protein
MPCVVQPGGGGGRIHVRYTACRKLALLAPARRLQGEGRLLQSTTDKLRVSVANLSRWVVQKIDKIDPMDAIFTKKKKAAHPGPLSQLMAIKEPLLHYIFKLCKQGPTINTFVIVLRASYILTKFCKKSFAAQCSSVKQFCYAHLMTYQMGTHMLQCPLVKVDSKALDFMQFMCQIILSINRNRRYVLNMDQMPVYFLMNAKRTLELIGGKTFARHLTTQSG